MNEDFKWTDELVGEFNRWEGFKPFKSGTPIEQFKQSKMPKKDKDYEVIEIINSNGGVITKRRDDKSWYECFSLRNFDGFKINAVKRVPTNEIFYVREIVVGKNHSPATIKYFKILGDDEMWAAFDEPNQPDCNIDCITKLPPQKEQSKPEQPNRERIEVKHFKMYEYSEGHVNQVFWYSFCVYKNIPNDKIDSVKAAIERVLNDDEVEVADSIVPAKVYNQGIGDAMEVVKHHNDKLGLNFPVGLMSQLNDLKKDYLNHKSKP